VKIFPLRNKIVRIGLFCLLSLSLVSWDKVTKDLAKAHLRDKPAQSYLGDTFRLEYVENTGFVDNGRSRKSAGLAGRMAW
jgi:hypothetical protein